MLPEGSSDEEKELSSAIDGLIKLNKSMSEELYMWRCLGTFDSVTKNVGYMTYVLSKMHEHPELKALLVMWMSEFMETELGKGFADQANTNQEWFEKTIGEMNLGGTTSGEDITA